MGFRTYSLGFGKTIHSVRMRVGPTRAAAHHRLCDRWRVACQVLLLTRLGERAQAPDAPVDKFPDWQENTNSIFWAAERLRQQAEVWLYPGTTDERPTHAARNQKEFTTALFRSVSGELLPS